MKPQYIPPPPEEVFAFLDEVRLTDEQEHDLDDAMVFYHYKAGWTGTPLNQPMHVLLGRMVEVGIPVAPCVMKYLEQVRKAMDDPRG